MKLPDNVHVPVRLEMMEKKEAQSVATVYFPAGSTANEVCECIAERNRKKFSVGGIWLLKMKTEEEEDFKDIKDAKYQLLDGVEYMALYFTAPDVFIVN